MRDRTADAKGEVRRWLAMRAIDSEVQVEDRAEGVHLTVLGATGVILVDEVVFELDAMVEGKRRAPHPPG
jgi:hypothetical protein